MKRSWTKLVIKSCSHSLKNNVSIIQVNLFFKGSAFKYNAKHYYLFTALNPSPCRIFNLKALLKLMAMCYLPSSSRLAIGLVGRLRNEANGSSRYSCHRPADGRKPKALSCISITQVLGIEDRIVCINKTSMPKCISYHEWANTVDSGICFVPILNAYGASGKPRRPDKRRLCCPCLVMENNLLWFNNMNHCSSPWSWRRSLH